MILTAKVSRQRGSVGFLFIGIRVCLAMVGMPFPSGGAENLALAKPVSSSGPNWGSFKPGSLTDGDPATFTHPAASSGTTGFTYEVDLGATRQLERIVLRNRQDGCCPERLTRFRVEVWSDSGGSTGTRMWSAALRADGSHSGVGGVDTITASMDPDGVFAGRFVRVVNASGAAYNPQLAEIEVYGGSAPVIRLFEATEDVLERGGSSVLHWTVDGATGAWLEPGLGSVDPSGGERTVAPSETTTYTLVATNAAGTVSASLTVGVDVVLLPPVLSEFMADNPGGASGLEDEDGDPSDWIELFNPNPYSIRLEGLFLTDDPSYGRKWSLPDIRVAAGGRYVVFASGKNRTNPSSGPAHTDFRLAAGGDFLALLDRDGVGVLDRFPDATTGRVEFPPQLAGVSYGRDPAGRVGFMRPATPGSTNGPAWDGVVASPVFSHERGLYDTGIDVLILSATPGAVIRYTTNRTDPGPTRGTVYSGPIPIAGTTVLKAAAFRPDWAPSEVAVRTYVIPSNVIGSSVMRRAITTHATYGPQLPAALRDLPSVSLTSTSTINDTTEVGGVMEWIPATGEGSESDGSAGAGSVQAGCGIRQFGGAFTDFAKKSFRLYFRSEYGAGRIDAPLFAGFERGVAAVDRFDQLELRSGSHDMAMRGFYLGNAFTDDTMLEMGRLNPHGRFVHLYLNGTYWGVYHLRERWGAAMHRRYLGGESEDYESINGNWNVGGWAEPGVPYDGDGSTWARVKSLRGDYPAVREWLDVPQFVDFMLMWMFGGAEDEYRCVGPNVPGSGFQFYLNDADGWFCIPEYCAAGNRTGRGAPGRSAGDGPGSLFSMLHASGNPDYRALLADRIQGALTGDGALTPARNRERLLRRSAEFERPFLAESARWGYLTPAEWAARRDSALNAWLPRRTADVLAQFRSAGFLPSITAPAIVPAGGEVQPGSEVGFSTDSQGVVHYTVDGTDPRLPGGAVSPSARTWVPAGGAGGGESGSLIPEGATWRWYTDAEGLGSSAIGPGHPDWSTRNWKHPEFDDGAWASGPAQLGYGEGDEATTLPFGSTASKWTSAYFRRSVVVPRMDAVTSTRLRLKCDDGAIVYLDGVELVRQSMPAGAVDGSTRAESSTDDGQGFTIHEIPPSALAEGPHTVAVELHQASPTTSDASFDLEWILVMSTPPGPAAFRIQVGTLVKARMKSGNQWSGLAEAFLKVGADDDVAPGDLVIRELAHHPIGTNGVEFIEIENVSNRAVNLRGARFDQGIRFAFAANRDVPLAPGGRIVLVNDLFRFRRKYGLAPEVAGVFAGRLDDRGEVIRLLDRDGGTLFAFEYRDAWPWPLAGETAGRTLVLARPELGMTVPGAWRGSVLPDGTPGRSDSDPFSGDPSLDLDGDGLPDLVEHALGSDPGDPLSGRDGMEIGLEADGWFVLRVPRNEAADDVGLTVETSANLATWAPAVRRRSEYDGKGRVRETWGVPAAAEPVFLRLVVGRRE